MGKAESFRPAPPLRHRPPPRRRRTPVSCHVDLPKRLWCVIRWHRDQNMKIVQFRRAPLAVHRWIIRVGGASPGSSLQSFESGGVCPSFRRPKSSAEKNGQHVKSALVAASSQLSMKPSSHSSIHV